MCNLPLGWIPDRIRIARARYEMPAARCEEKISGSRAAQYLYTSELIRMMSFSFLPDAGLLLKLSSATTRKLKRAVQRRLHTDFTVQQIVTEVVNLRQIRNLLPRLSRWLC